MLYEFTVPNFVKALTNLSKFLDKAETFAKTKKIDMEVLLNSRLAPDQFNFIRQVQIACDSAKLGCFRLTGKEAPTMEDNEKTVPELKARIEKTVSYLKSLTPADFKGSEEKRITQPRWEGKSLSGYEAVTLHITPNVFFHVTTAYAILRHNGVELGKKDFLGELPFKS